MNPKFVRASLVASVVLGAALSAGGCTVSTAGAEDDATSAASALTTSENSFAPGGEVATVGEGTAPAANPAYPACHPHLFARSVDYSAALNYHVDLFLHHVVDLLKLRPRVAGTTYTWDFRGADASVQLVLTKTAPGVFDVVLGVAPPGGASTFQTVVTGMVDRSDPLDVQSHFSFDFDALHQVFPAAAADKSQGQLAIDVDRAENADGSDRKRTVTYTLTGFVPVYGDPHGPRTGNVYLLDEPGIGGAMVYDASAVYFCPANPSLLAADSNVFARWFVRSGVVEGRADAVATGGQFVAGGRWVGLTCRSIQASEMNGTTTIVDNGYWMMKEEDATGATVGGAAVADTSAADPPCDPALGPVTDLGDDAQDPTVPSTIPADAFPGQF